MSLTLTISERVLSPKGSPGCVGECDIVTRMAKMVSGKELVANSPSDLPSSCLVFHTGLNSEKRDTEGVKAITCEVGEWRATV